MKKSHKNIYLVFLFFGSMAHSASFDCQKARSTNEFLICGDSELSQLDDQLAQQYKYAIKRSENYREIIENQKSAWRQREKDCSSKICLIDWYAQRKSYFIRNSQNSLNISKLMPSTYLPSTLDIHGFESGKCENSELARTFKEVRGWASESSGWINVHSIIESPEKIIISYYDGLLKFESIRTFYKDMETCKYFRK